MLKKYEGINAMETVFNEQRKLPISIQDCFSEANELESGINVNRWDRDTMYCDLMISRRFRVLETEALTVGRRKGGVSIGGRLDLGLVDSDEPFE